MEDPQFIIGVFTILVGVGGMMMGVKMILAKKRPSLNRITPTGRPAKIMGVILLLSGIFVIAGYFLLGRYLLETKPENIETDGYIEIDLSDE